MPSPLCFMLSSAPFPPSAVEGRVKEVDVLLIHAILGQAQTFSEPLKMHDLAGPQELDDIVDVGVIRQPQDVVIGYTGLLLCCKVKVQHLKSSSGFRLDTGLSLEYVYQQLCNQLAHSPSHG